MAGQEHGYRWVRFGDVSWERRTEDDWPPLVKRLYRDETTDLSMNIVWYGRGVEEPRHVHDGTHATWLLVGEAAMDGETAGPLDLVYGPGGVPHGPLRYRMGCVLFSTMNGSTLHTAVGAGESTPPDEGLPPRLVFHEDQPWAAGDVVGTESRLMVDDPARDYRARLVRWAPASTTGQHAHPGSHALLVMAGSVVIGETRLGPWDLLYAPGGVAHGPIESPEGCLLLMSGTGKWNDLGS